MQTVLDCNTEAWQSKTLPANPGCLSCVCSGKTPEKDSPLGGALLSEVSTLFEMLMTQKADAHPGPPPDVLYRLSAAYRRSLGLDASATSAANPANAASTPLNSGNGERRSGVALPTGLCHQWAEPNAHCRQEVTSGVVDWAVNNELLPRLHSQKKKKELSTKVTLVGFFFSATRDAHSAALTPLTWFFILFNFFFSDNLERQILKNSPNGFESTLSQASFSAVVAA